MKALTLSIGLAFCLNIAAQTDSVLFIGNSYTSTGNVPGVFKNIATQAGKSVYIDSYTPGGKQLSQHYTDATTLSKITAHQWDYVSIQEQSQMPALYPNTTISYAQALAINKIKANNKCTETIVYMTWSRQDGNSWLQSTGWTYQQMADYYEDFYEDIWKYVPGRVSAVGKAFHKATAQGINVYSGDGSHQNTTGTYISALTFYATIYMESTVGLSNEGLDANLALQCQQIVDEVVLSDLYEHNLKKVKFLLSETEITEGQTINFTEQVYMEPFPDSFEWTFEGATNLNSTDENPSSIQFNSAGTFDVSLTISDECGYSETRTYNDTVKVTAPTAISQLGDKINWLQNSALTSFNQPIILNQNFDWTFNLYDITGKVIDINHSINYIQINSEINPGIYILQGEKEGNSISAPIIIKN